MNDYSKRFALALCIAVLGSVFFKIFGIGPEEIDKFFNNIVLPLGVMLALGVNVHTIFPVRKSCSSCGNRLKGLLSPKLIKFYKDASKSSDRKSLMKAIYVCENCGDAFSPKLKKMGNLNN
jgi:hypothetical protein